MPPRPSMEEMRTPCPDLDEDFFQRAKEGFARLDKAKKTNRNIAVFSAMFLTAGLIYAAHKLNLFGEKH